MMERTFLTIVSSLQERRLRLPEVLRGGAAKGNAMQSRWLARLFFAVVAVMAVAGVVSGTACTRWGQPGPAVPSVAPLSALYVDPTTGSDTSGNGSMSKPFKTFTKAVDVLASSKTLSPSGVTIYLANGNYIAANGEKFPIVIPTNVTITGTSYGSGIASGTFINGFGEDKIFEEIVHAPAHSAYTTLEIVPSASVSLSNVYIGASKLSLPSSKAFYASFDNLGTVVATTTTFGAGITSLLRNVDGVIDPSGSFSCSSCAILGHDFGIGAFSVPIATSSPPVPTVSLTRSTATSTISAKVVDILTDSSANVTTSSEAFELADYAYSDALTPLIPILVRGSVDFGGGVASSTGGNAFIGAQTTEIWITRDDETVTAYGDYWNPNQQGASRNGLYRRDVTFAAGAIGKNVTIRTLATNSTVLVGPAPVPTPTPSITPSISPSPSPT
jgi:hypothetical protein